MDILTLGIIIFHIWFIWWMGKWVLQCIRIVIKTTLSIWHYASWHIKAYKKYPDAEDWHDSFKKKRFKRLHLINRAWDELPGLDDCRYETSLFELDYRNIIPRGYWKDDRRIVRGIKITDPLKINKESSNINKNT